MGTLLITNCINEKEKGLMWLCLTACENRDCRQRVVLYRYTAK